MFRIIVVKNKIEKVLEEGLTEKEAILSLEEWMKLYTPENFFDPVPKVKIERSYAAE